MGWPSWSPQRHHDVVAPPTQQATQPIIRGPIAVLFIILALPILFVLRYLFLVLGAVVFWSAGLRDGAQLDAANAVFATFLLGGLYAGCRCGFLARWVSVSVGALTVLSVLLPLVR